MGFLCARRSSGNQVFSEFVKIVITFDVVIRRKEIESFPENPEVAGKNWTLL